MALDLGHRSWRSKGLLYPAYPMQMADAEVAASGGAAGALSPAGALGRCPGPRLSSCSTTNTVKEPGSNVGWL